MLWMKGVKRCKSIQEKPINFLIVTVLENCGFCLPKAWNQPFFPLSLQIMVTWLRYGKRRDLITNWWVMLYNFSCNQSCSKQNPTYMLVIIHCGWKDVMIYFSNWQCHLIHYKKATKRTNCVTKYLHSMKNTYISTGITTPDFSPEC